MGERSGIGALGLPWEGVARDEDAAFDRTVPWYYIFNTKLLTVSHSLFAWSFFWEGNRLRR